MRPKHPGRTGPNVNGATFSLESPLSAVIYATMPPSVTNSRIANMHPVVVAISTIAMYHSAWGQMLFTTRLEKNSIVTHELARQCKLPLFPGRISSPSQRGQSRSQTAGAGRDRSRTAFHACLSP